MKNSKFNKIASSVLIGVLSCTTVSTASSVLAVDSITNIKIKESNVQIVIEELNNSYRVYVATNKDVSNIVVRINVDGTKSFVKKIDKLTLGETIHFDINKEELKENKVLPLTAIERKSYDFYEVTKNHIFSGKISYDIENIKFNNDELLEKAKENNRVELPEEKIETEVPIENVPKVELPEEKVETEIPTENVPKVELPEEKVETEVPTENVPKVELPEEKIETEVPTENVPKVELPEEKVETEIPTENVPKVELPEEKIETEIPTENVPKVELPEEKVETEVPTENVPKVELPEEKIETEIPKENVPKVELPEEKIETEIPTENVPKVELPEEKVETEIPTDVPIVELPKYEILEKEEVEEQDISYNTETRENNTLLKGEKKVI